MEENKELEEKKVEKVVVVKKKKAHLTSFAIKIIIIVLAIIILPLMFGLGVKLSYLFNTQEKTTKLGLRNVGELVTQTCHTVVVEDSKVSRTFFDLFEIPFTTSRQIFSYDFEVDASVNFDKIDFSNVSEDNKTIEVKLPHAKVYKSTIKPESLKIYVDSESLFSRIDLSKHNDAVLKMQEQAKNDCVTNGLLDAADENAKQLIKGMITGNEVFKHYDITFSYTDEKEITINEENDN